MYNQNQPDGLYIGEKSMPQHKCHSAFGVLWMGLMPILLSGCAGILSNGPVAMPGINQTVMVNTEVALDGSASFDPAGNPLTFSWRQVNGVPVILSNPNQAFTTFFPDLPGIYSFELTVDNGVGGTDSSVVIITVIP